MNLPKIFKCPHLAALFAVCVLSVLLSTLNQQPSTGLLLLGLWQLSQIAMSPRRSTCSIRALTDDQIEEFEGICKSFGGYANLLKELPNRLKKIEDTQDEQQSRVRSLTKLRAASFGDSGSQIQWRHGQPYIPDAAAEGLAAWWIMEAKSLPNALERLIPDAGNRKTLVQRAERIAQSFSGAAVRTALDSTTTPLPTIYAPLIIELVFAYGAARKYSTVFPLGAGTVKLPRLKVGEDAFGFIGIGTAGMSQGVPEKRVSAELVTFTANKAGGLIRIPTEIEDDTFIPFGQFLARYIARQFAKLEDTTLFLGDGTGTYADITGVGPYCVANAAYLQQLAATKTKPTDASLSDFRALRSKVNPAVLVGTSQTGETMACYYMHPTMEALLVSFNTIGSPLIYRPSIAGQPPTLDGFPIRWIGVSQAYSQLAAAGTFLAFFGDLTYWYLGERGTPRIELSRDVFFATDELAMRALERIDVESMAVDSMAALQTAAS